MYISLRQVILSLGLIFFCAGCGGGGSTGTLFTQLDKDRTGIDFRNTLFDGEALNVLNYIYFYNGGGVAIGDINNDGLPDILFTGNMVHNRLFLNKGNFTFEDITARSHIAEKEGWCTGATMVDINGDGLTDIYICRSAAAVPSQRENLLYINNGDQTFSEKAAEYGLADPGFSTQAAFFDYDKDGDLDMILINHSLHQYATGAVDNPGWRKERMPAYECKLYRCDYDARLKHAVYTDVSEQSGIRSNVLTFGLGLAVSDINNDGWPDVYISNDFNEPDYLFINNGAAAGGGAVTFTERLSECMDQTSLYSMGNDAADYNNDGWVDLMTLDMLPEDNHTQKMHSGAENFNKFQQLFGRGFYYQYSRNMLQLNNGDGTFSEVGQLDGVSNTDWSWSALFTDMDNDGYKDLMVTNGYVKDYTDMDFLKYSADKAMRGGATSEDKETMVKDAIAKMPPSPGVTYLFRNLDGRGFKKVNNEWGLTQKTVSAGAAYADLDNDGAMDLVISNTNEYAGIFKNNARTRTKGHYLKVALKGDPANGTGIGSKVKLYCKDTVYYQEAFPVRGFQSSVDPVLNFGLGDHDKIDSMLVIWPDDHYQVLKALAADEMVKIEKKNAMNVWDYRPRSNASLLKAEAAAGPAYPENNFSDFDVQPLLLNYLSRSGPCMARTEIDKDGKSAVFIGGSKGHAAHLYVQTAAGALKLSRQPAIEKDSLGEDGAAEFFDANGDGAPDLLVAGGGYEFEENDPSLQARLYLNDGKGQFVRAEGAVPAWPASVGVVRAADVDGDGDLDLFLGGRVVPGKYPLSPGSRIWLNDGKGHFTDGTPHVAPELTHSGMVTDAVWIDLDKDGKQDLVMVGEWMPIKVYLNRGGKLEDVSGKYIHFPSAGWWNRIEQADLDGDGRPDLVLGNQGLNNQFQASEKEPLTLYYKDFDNNGTIDPIFCYYIDGVSYPAASRDDLTTQVPMLKKKFLEYHDYADATIQDLFTPDQLKDAGPLRADMLKTIVLMNRGDSGFQLKELPEEAQYAPVYAIAAEDINGDGHKDLVLAGNNQWTRIRFGRWRASHGELLLNDGKGNFKYVPQPASGLKLREDVRGVLELGGKKLLFGVNDGPAQIYSY
ncbi:MAG TPA: VCBS repeat-containing protein [Puia sp.]